jgi:lysophospholipase L1-like esterase
MKKLLLFILIILLIGCETKKDTLLSPSSFDSNLNKNLFFGDSIIALNNWENSFNNCTNAGVSGSTAENWIAYKMIYNLNDTYNNVFILLGVNDLGRGYTVNNTIINYNSILNIIDNKSSSIYILSVMSINVSKYTQSFGKIKHYLNMSDKDVVSFNSNLKNFVNNKITYIDTYSVMCSNGQLKSRYTDDGIHPNSLGYSNMILKIKEGMN